MRWPTVRGLLSVTLCVMVSDEPLYTMTMTSQDTPTTKSPHFATLLVMALAPEEIGERIAERRRELGWTHEQLARQMDVGLRTVQRWQKGRDPKTGQSWLPRLGTLMELADVMGVERSYFVETKERSDGLVDRLESLEERVTEGFESVEVLLKQLASQLPRRDAR